MIPPTDNLLVGTRIRNKVRAQRSQYHWGRMGGSCIILKVWRAWVMCYQHRESGESGDTHLKHTRRMSPITPITHSSISPQYTLKFSLLLFHKYHKWSINFFTSQEGAKRSSFLFSPPSSYTSRRFSLEQPHVFFATPQSSPRSQFAP